MAFGFPARFTESRTFPLQQDELLTVVKSTLENLGWSYQVLQHNELTASVHCSPFTFGEEFKARVLLNGVIQVESKCVRGGMYRMPQVFFSGAWLGRALGNRYELKFIRSEDAGGELRKIYAYSLISCSERKDGVMVVQASRMHYYTIDINGAGESDPRAQRALTSIKVK